MFQFPSNGKAYPKFSNRAAINAKNEFQFPSNGKAYPKLIAIFVLIAAACFNSLQTGKHIQRDPILHPMGTWFGIPQNQTRTARGIFLSKFNPKIA